MTMLFSIKRKIKLTSSLKKSVAKVTFVVDIEIDLFIIKYTDVRSTHRLNNVFPARAPNPRVL